MQKWFEQARFGMFIHWGLYSIPAGEWNGMTVPWVAEWIMNKFRIPAAEYEKLASRFNPVKFSAEQWVSAAKNAGMKYMVFTAKHHDGFAMFHSRYDRYNVFDATPFHRDVLAELAAECRKQGIRLGCYYSQDQDWHESGASGNNWDFKGGSPAAFQKYLDGKVKHQLREILTDYGKIAVIWFDTPRQITAEQSRDLRDYVHSLQPECLVSGRVGNGMGDYNTLGDNQIPASPFDSPTEGLGTMNDSWGFRRDDHAYRTTEQLIRILAVMVSRNANYLLNVGPRSDGTFPPEAVSRLRGIGNFMKVNSEAVYSARDAGKVLLPVPLPWGEVTMAGKNVYLWIFRRRPVTFYGLRNRIRSASVLGSGETVEFRQESRPEHDWYRFSTDSLPVKKTPFVIRLSVEGTPEFNAMAYCAGHS